ncbi:acetate--CoA ligase family protein [Saccharopolyspora sp. WRP15-2]|uniref:Acetate--CoA ligase family protein n=1 Tax=Saccharopolyspora oryzae TaxID=2997343 RepID=A0ABT4USK3_9PSEU|nr:acetate--CoA ligase family protein [Saccharopolyspora oryzae]MDA3624099.1 acetate--CoA ligase family protein [Saccharopolyspora oryzae]
MLLNYDEMAKSLSAAGVPLVKERLAADAAEAVAAADEFGVPVVLKLVSPALVHKSDVGAVLLDVRGHDAAVEAAGRLAELASELSLGVAGWQILVQEMVESTTIEVFAGLKRDPVFGPIVVVGAGGRLVELLPDRAIAGCPVTTDEAANMLRSTALGKALGGYRGQRDVIDEVAGVVAAASRLPEVIPGLVEADLNPIVITEHGPLVVDARVAAEDIAPESEPAAGDAPQLHLSALLEPESVMVIGASASTVQPGNRVLGYLRKRGYQGRVTVVHPTADEVDGYPAVRSIADIPHGEIDLACVAVAASGCVEVVEQCGAVGVPAVVMLSSGFSEVGDTELEQRLVEAADRHGITLCGPNTVGIMSPGKHVHVSFSQAQDMTRIPDGGVALVVQSGAIGGSLASQAWERGIGISRFISVGNQAALNTSDYIDHLTTDEATHTIAVILEGVTDGRALLASIQRATAAGKPVLVLKNGRSVAGARAVQSHTGSIAGDYAVYRALLERSGATPVDTTTDLLDALQLRQSTGGLPAGARMAIMSTSGGACSMTADLCTHYGFQVPTFSAELQAELGGILPGYAAFANPVDVTGRVTADPTIFGRSLEAILASDETDAVAVMVTTVADPMAEQLAEQIVDQVATTTNPVIVAWTIAAELAARGLSVLRDAGIPVYDDPARALHAVSLANGTSEGISR